MQVRDVMTTQLLTVPPFTSVTAVAAVMRDSDVGCVLVVTDGHVHGLITDRDLAVRVVAEGEMTGQATALEAASGDLVSVRPDTPVCEAAETMREHAFRRLPVITEDERLVGVVTLGDLAHTPHAQEVLAALSTAEANH